MLAVKSVRLFIRSALPFVLSVPLFLLSATRSYAQSSSDKAPPASATTIVTNVDEVYVDFIARHKEEPVWDLTPADILITDDGTPVKPSSLRIVNQQPGTNYLITLLFDRLDPSAATNAREIAKKVLKLIPPERFSLSVFSTGARLRLLQEFTADRQLVQKAVGAATEVGSNGDQAAADSERRLISAVQPGTASQVSPYERSVELSLLASLTESRRIVQNQHVPGPLAGLLGLLRAQTPIPGRKLLVYFTEGLPPGTDAQDALRTIAGAANRAEVSIYVINQAALDTKVMDGLVASAAIGGMASASRMASMSQAPQSPLAAGMAAQTPVAYGPGMAAQINDQITRIEGEGLAGSKDPLGGMAASTGGAYLFSEDNLKKPFRRAVADLTTYYEASYVPPAIDYNGKFRQVSVKVLRPGLKAQSRAGYFAVPPATGVRPFEAPILKFFSEPQLPADVNFRAKVLQLGSFMTGNENALFVEAPISGLDTRSDVNTNLISWHVSIVSQIKNSSGAVVEHFSEDDFEHGALDATERSTSATMQRHFALPPGEYTLETAVVDRYSGKVGGQRARFDVPNGASGPFLSDVALVQRIDSDSDESDPLDPMRYENGKVVPGLSGQVLPGTKDTSFFFLVHPDSGIAEPAMLELQVLRNGELFGQVPLQLPKDLGDAFPYLASLRTSSLPAGSYSVMLSLTQGEKVMEREASFSIGGPVLANAATGKPSPMQQSQESAMMADSGLGETEINPAARPPLVITSLPQGSVTRPSDDELDRMIAGARKHAVNYSVKLPNFLCVEMTNRAVDPTGNGKWRRRDSFGELLRFADNKETRTTLEVDGRPSTMNRDDMEQWPISLGEFGDLLNLVFQPSSKAEFHWKETDALANGTVQVFEYRVERKNNSMFLTDNTSRIRAGFHGMAYIDSATTGIRRITMEADDLPPSFAVHAASIAVDYDYVSIGAHDYLMPVRGTIRLKRGRHEADLNQIVFQDYRRYASQTKIKVVP
ncbi:MAG: VWA domain-containing protein [Terriglobales bacterium]